MDEQLVPLTKPQFDVAYAALCKALTEMGITINGRTPGDPDHSHHFRLHLWIVWGDALPQSQGGFVLGHNQHIYGKLFGVPWDDWHRHGQYAFITKANQTTDQEATAAANKAIFAAIDIATT